MRTTTFLLPWLLLLITAGGCASIQECQMHWALKCRAKEAYKQAGCQLPYGAARHYERGWLAGYCEVAEGGNGCAPPLPPEVYWGFKYQNPEGQAAIETWFQGFHDGAALAQAEGVQQYNYLPSPHLGAPVYPPAFDGGAMAAANTNPAAAPRPALASAAKPAPATAATTPATAAPSIAAPPVPAAQLAVQNRDFPVRLPLVVNAAAEPIGPATPVLEMIQQTSATSEVPAP